jgi:superfamily II DNA or RNA helicase
MKDVIGAYIKHGPGTKVVYEDDTMTEGSSYHLVMRMGVFTPMVELIVGDKLDTLYGGYKIVKSVESIPEDDWYDFSLDYEHECYIQNGLIHHNSGKSLFIAGIARFLQTIFQPEEKILIIVPNISLVNQFAYDLCDYFSADIEWLKTDPIHTIFAGQEKNVQSQIIVSTWQSLVKMPREYFGQFRCVMCDEAHLVDGKSYTKVATMCYNAEYRFGFSGSIKNTKTHLLTLEGIFGKSKVTITTKELMEEGSVTELDIRGLQIKYPVEICDQQRKINDYSAEIESIITSEERNRFICKLALSQKGNGLILVDKVDKHAKPLYAMMRQMAGDRPVFYITGEVKGSKREEIRLDMSNYENAIIIANYQTMSTGVNIPSLNWLIFGSPTKSFARVIQSIGRILRLHKSKTLVTLFDIIDDMRIKPRTSVHENYAWKHALERLNFYSEQKFDVQMRKVPLFVKD